MSSNREQTASYSKDEENPSSSLQTEIQTDLGTDPKSTEANKHLASKTSRTIRNKSRFKKITLEKEPLPGVYLLLTRSSGKVKQSVVLHQYQYI